MTLRSMLAPFLVNLTHLESPFPLLRRTLPFKPSGAAH